MLTISKPLSAGQAQSYHQKEFTCEGAELLVAARRRCRRVARPSRSTFGACRCGFG